MEFCHWFVVFVCWAVWKCSEEEMTWYIIGIKSYKNGSLQLDEVDAVLCECSMDVLTYAKQRYRTKYGQSLYAEACLTMKHIERAKTLHNQHALDDQVKNWTDADWQEFCDLPAYSGDQDKYLRTWTS
jgi:hypothetical protein